MGATAERFRKLALACPEAAEGAHQGHADFRHAGREFATLQPDGVTAMVKVSPGGQRELLATHDAFRPASGAWGRAGCTLVDLEAVTQRVLRDAVTAAWEFCAATAAARQAKK